MCNLFDYPSKLRTLPHYDINHYWEVQYDLSRHSEMFVDRAGWKIFKAWKY